MKRDIYEVTAKVVDASGGYNNLSGYPSSFDSHHYNDDLDKTRRRAMASYNDACKAGYNADGRPLTVVAVFYVNDCIQIERTIIGKMPELPDPEPEPNNGGEE